MELKKYFLVDNLILRKEDIKEKYDDLNLYYWWIGPQINGSNHGRQFTRFYERDIKKTSDTVLDLIDVGDLLGVPPITNGMLNLSEVKEEIVMITTLKHSKLNMISTNRGDVIFEEIKAIYKRQSNGDYKRCEVKQEEESK